MLRAHSRTVFGASLWRKLWRWVVGKTVIRESLGLFLRWNTARKFMWKNVAQRLEFQFHKLYARRPEGVLLAEASALFEYFGYDQDQFQSKTVLDVGAGSQLLTGFFRGARVIAIEPLGEEFLSEFDWCGLRHASEVFSVPAEMRIDRLVNQVDMAVSVNVLDHCFDPAAVVRNIYDYLRIGGEACVSVDCHGTPDPVHPLPFSESTVEALLRQVGFSIKKVIRGLDGVYPEPRSGYGAGETVTFILSKRVPANE